MSNDAHNQNGYLALIGSMVFTLAFMIYIVFIHPGIELDNNAKPETEQTN